MRQALLFVIVTACGRIGFDVTGGDTAVDDASGQNEAGANGDAGADGAPDAFAAVCANAMIVNVGSTAALDTCQGTLDNIDACSPNKREKVFKFIPPTTRGYTIRARDAGTMNVSNSTARMDSACVQTGGCTGVLGTTLTAGTTYYFVVEASATACASIEFEIQ